MAAYGANRDGPPQLDGMISLKVDNISFQTTVGDLTPMFEKFGKVGDVYIPRDKETRKSRGFAFVRFYSQDDAEEAVDSLDGTDFDGRTIEVKVAKHARPEMDRGFAARSDRSRGSDRDRYDRNGGRDHRDRDRERSYDRYESRHSHRRDDRDDRDQRSSRYASPPRHRRHRSYSPPPPPPRYQRSPPRPPMPPQGRRYSRSPSPPRRGYSPHARRY